MIDPDTGLATSVGNTGDRFAAMAFAANGILYGVTGNGGSRPETLFSLSTTDATPTLLTALGGGGAGESLAFNPANGLLYRMSGSNVFQSIDPITLATTNIPLTQDPQRHFSEPTSLTYWASEDTFLATSFYDAFRLTPTVPLTFVGQLQDSSKGFAFLGPEDSDIKLFVTSEDVTVVGRHTYASAGEYFPSVTLYDDSGGVVHGAADRDRRAGCHVAGSCESARDSSIIP